MPATLYIPLKEGENRLVTYRTDVNHSWAPERKIKHHNVRFPVTEDCLLTKNYSSMLLVL